MPYLDTRGLCTPAAHHLGSTLMTQGAELVDGMADSSKGVESMNSLTNSVI